MRAIALYIANYGSFSVMAETQFVMEAHMDRLSDFNMLLEVPLGA